MSKISPTHTSAVIDLPKLLALNDGQPVGPGSRILRFAGQLISIASVLPPETPHASTVRCRRRPKRRACEGSLTIIRRSIEDDIVWECPRCGDRGHIVGWQDSHWDREPALRSGAIVSLLQVRAERAEHPRDAHPKLGQPSLLLEFQVELIGGPQDLTEIVTRRVRINGERSLHDLHLLLQRAFDRDTNEPYEFMFGAPYEPAARRFSGGIIASSEETNEPWETQTLTLDNLNLQLGQAFGYLFDFGEEWVHRVTLISTEKDLSGATYARVIERVGASPPQFPTGADTWDDELLWGDIDDDFPLSSLYGPYLPNEAPDAESWLSMEDLERLLLVIEAHSQDLPVEHPRISSLPLHAVIHFLAETRIAEGDQEIAARMKTLHSSRMPRHQAIHEIGEEIVRDQLHHAPKELLTPKKRRTKSPRKTKTRSKLQGS